MESDGALLMLRPDSHQPNFQAIGYLQRVLKTMKNISAFTYLKERVVYCAK